MKFSPFYRKDLQPSKWNRTRINYELVEAIMIAKEYFEPSMEKRTLNIQKTVWPDENK